MSNWNQEQGEGERVLNEEYDTRRAELIEVAVRLMSGRLSAENSVNFDAIGAELDRERVAARYVDLAQKIIEKAEYALRELNESGD